MFLQQYIVLAAIGLVLGMAVDVAFTKIADTVDSKKRKYVRAAIALLQLVACGVVLYVLHTYTPWITQHFQTSLPGLAFDAVFFSTQVNVFISLHALYAR
jgi:hypothetical protein